MIISLRQKNWFLLKTKFDTASFSTMLTKIQKVHGFFSSSPFLQAHYKACHVILAVSCIIYFCNARLPQCLERCDHCKNLADGDYDIESCQSYCFRGSPDPHCSKFLTNKIKRGPIAKIWACIQYCRHCKLTYPQYNGEKCVSMCEESGGTSMDLNCMEYWPWNWWKGWKQEDYTL